MGLTQKVKQIISSLVVIFLCIGQSAQIYFYSPRQYHTVSRSTLAPKLGVDVRILQKSFPVEPSAVQDEEPLNFGGKNEYYLNESSRRPKGKRLVIGMREEEYSGHGDISAEQLVEAVNGVRKDLEELGVDVLREKEPTSGWQQYPELRSEVQEFTPFGITLLLLVGHAKYGVMDSIEFAAKWAEKTKLPRQKDIKQSVHIVIPEYTLYVSPPKEGKIVAREKGIMDIGEIKKILPNSRFNFNIWRDGKLIYSSITGEENAERRAKEWNSVSMSKPTVQISLYTTRDFLKKDFTLQQRIFRSMSLEKPLVVSALREQEIQAKKPIGNSVFRRPGTILARDLQKMMITRTLERVPEYRLVSLEELWKESGLKHINLSLSDMQILLEEMLGKNDVYAWSEGTSPAIYFTNKPAVSVPGFSYFAVKTFFPRKIFSKKNGPTASMPALESAI